MINNDDQDNHHGYYDDVLEDHEAVLLMMIMIMVLDNLDEVSHKNTMTMMVINEGEGTMRTSSILVKSLTKTLTRTKVADPVAFAPGGLKTKLSSTMLSY